MLLRPSLRSFSFPVYPQASRSTRRVATRIGEAVDSLFERAKGALSPLLGRAAPALRAALPLLLVLGALLGAYGALPSLRLLSFFQADRHACLRALDWSACWSSPVLLTVVVMVCVLLQSLGEATGRGAAQR